MIEIIIKDRVLINSYPIIKKSESGNIVLFTQSKTGTVLNSESKSYPIGYYTENWSDEDFKAFSGEICLFNKEK